MTQKRICLACGKDELYQVLDLGQQPLANHLLPHADDAYQTHPLGLMACPFCGHGQLSFFVPPAELFDHYLYASGTSLSLGDYFDWFADEAARHFPQKASVLELACNDGSLLRRLKDKGFATLGVDPAQNLVKEAQESGLEVLCDYWPCLKQDNARTFDLIIAMNVVAHTPDPLTFLKGVAAALSDNGVCVVQTSQARMLMNGEFDTIYHEHCSFFVPRSFAALAARAGLVVRKTRLVDVHGVSFAFILTKPDSTKNIDTFLTSAPYAVDPQGITDKLSGDAKQHQHFGETARARIEKVRTLLTEHRSTGRKICFVGAAAKAMVFLHALGIKPDALYDEAPLKIDRHVPSLGCKIDALPTIAEQEGPILVVISAWNFRKELAAKTAKHLAGRDVRFLVYFPNVEEF